jgi:hypothetical protein
VAVVRDGIVDFEIRMGCIEVVEDACSCFCAPGGLSAAVIGEMGRRSAVGTERWSRRRCGCHKFVMFAW